MRARIRLSISRIALAYVSNTFARYSTKLQCTLLRIPKSHNVNISIDCSSSSMQKKADAGMAWHGILLSLLALTTVFFWDSIDPTPRRETMGETALLRRST